MNEHFYDHHPERPTNWDDEPLTETWIEDALETTFVGDHLLFGDRMIMLADELHLYHPDDWDESLYREVCQNWSVNDAQLLREDLAMFMGIWAKIDEIEGR